MLYTIKYKLYVLHHCKLFSELYQFLPGSHLFQHRNVYEKLIYLQRHSHRLKTCCKFRQPFSQCNYFEVAFKWPHKPFYVLACKSRIFYIKLLKLSDLWLLKMKKCLLVTSLHVSKERSFLLRLIWRVFRGSPKS